MSRYKRLYDSLIINEELLEMFPGLLGEWLLDKKEFILLQQQMEDFSSIVDTEEEDFNE